LPPDFVPLLINHPGNIFTLTLLIYCQCFLATGLWGGSPKTREHRQKHARWAEGWAGCCPALARQQFASLLGQEPHCGSPVLQPPRWAATDTAQCPWVWCTDRRHGRKGLCPLNTSPLP